MLIVGAGGHGRMVADIAKLSHRYDQIAFVDDNSISYSGSIKIVCEIREIDAKLDGNDVFIAIGNNHTRKTLMSQLKQKGAHFATLVHPSAVIAEDVAIGPGGVVAANAVVNCGSRIGKGVIINTAATIDHDNQIHDYAHISPGAHLGGTVQVGEMTWIGIGAAVSNNVEICGGCTVGAGSVVIKDINLLGVYAGVPAKRL